MAHPVARAYVQREKKKWSQKVRQREAARQDVELLPDVSQLATIEAELDPKNVQGYAPTTIRSPGTRRAVGERVLVREKEEWKTICYPSPSALVHEPGKEMLGLAKYLSSKLDKTGYHLFEQVMQWNRFDCSRLLGKEWTIGKMYRDSLKVEESENDELMQFCRGNSMDW